MGKAEGDGNLVTKAIVQQTRRWRSCQYGRGRLLLQSAPHSMMDQWHRRILGTSGARKLSGRMPDSQSS